MTVDINKNVEIALQDGTEEEKNQIFSMVSEVIASELVNDGIAEIVESKNKELGIRALDPTQSISQIYDRKFKEYSKTQVKLVLTKVTKSIQDDIADDLLKVFDSYIDSYMSLNENDIRNLTIRGMYMALGELKNKRLPNKRKIKAGVKHPTSKEVKELIELGIKKDELKTAMSTNQWILN